MYKATCPRTKLTSYFLQVSVFMPFSQAYSCHRSTNNRRIGHSAKGGLVLTAGSAGGKEQIIGWKFTSAWTNFVLLCSFEEHSALKSWIELEEFTLANGRTNGARPNPNLWDALSQAYAPPVLIRAASPIKAICTVFELAQLRRRRQRWRCHRRFWWLEPGERDLHHLGRKRLLDRLGERDRGPVRRRAQRRWDVGWVSQWSDHRGDGVLRAGRIRSTRKRVSGFVHVRNSL